MMSKTLILIIMVASLSGFGQENNNKQYFTGYVKTTILRKTLTSEAEITLVPKTVVFLLQINEFPRSCNITSIDIKNDLSIFLLDFYKNNEVVSFKDCEVTIHDHAYNAREWNDKMEDEFESLGFKVNYETSFDYYPEQFAKLCK